MIIVDSCPICKSRDLTPELFVRDHSISQEQFQVMKCGRCSLVLTSPRPENSDLARYYESPAYISHHTKPTSLIEYIYRAARKRNSSSKLKLITTYSTERNILDFGCGTGSFLKYCLDNAWRVKGVEPSLAASHAAKDLLGGSSVVNSLDDIAETFPVITLWHVLEHVPDLNETIAALKARLANNGFLFIAVPNVNSWDSRHYGANWAGLDVPRHLWHFSKTNITKLLQQHGLESVAIKPLKFDSYYVSLLSEQYKRMSAAGVTGMINAAKNGFLSNLDARNTGEYSSLIYIFQHARN